MLITPSLRQFTNNSSIDANKSNIFYFDVVGGDLVVKNRLYIQNTSTNEVVYDKTITTYSLQHTVASKVLRNGVTYKAKIMTYNQNDISSEWSDWIIFSAYSDPVVVFSNIGDGNITSQEYTFNAKYTQAEGLNIKNYKFLMYDDNKNLIHSSETISNKTLSYIVTFENEKDYYIEFKVTSLSNATATTGLHLIHVKYIESEGGEILEVKNNSEDGTIDLKVKVKDVLFKLLDGSISYIANDWIDLTSGSIYTDKSLGFDIADDEWSLIIKFTTRSANNEILKIMDGNNNYIVFEKINNRVYIKNYYNGEIIHNSWVELGDIMLDDEIFITFQKKGFGFNKFVKVKYIDRNALLTNENKEVTTNKDKSILVSRRKEVFE